MSTEIGLKEKLLARCIQLKEESEANIMAAMNEAQQAANEYGPPKDRYDSFRTQLLRKRDMLAQQLATVEEELRFLRQHRQGGISEKVEIGALVFLEAQILFIMTGIGKVETEGMTVYVVSPVVPLVAAMQGLRKGDRFSFRGNSMKIIDIQ